MLRLLPAAVAACFLVLPAVATAETRTFTATADAPVASAWPSVNYGGHNRLLVNLQGSSSATRESYVKFNVSLPAGARVTGARMRLYATALYSSGTSLWRAGNAWTETGLTWANRPAPTSGELYRDVGTTPGWREFPDGHRRQRGPDLPPARARHLAHAVPLPRRPQRPAARRHVHRGRQQRAAPAAPDHRLSRATTADDMARPGLGAAHRRPRGCVRNAER